MSLIAKLEQPKEPVIALMPLVIAKAIMIAFERKISESLAELIVCTDAVSNRVAGQIRKWQEEIGIPTDSLEKELELPKWGTSENMLFLFCLGLFNSSDCHIKAVNKLRHQTFGADNKNDDDERTNSPLSLQA